MRFVSQNVIHATLRAMAVMTLVFEDHRGMVVSGALIVKAMVEINTRYQRPLPDSNNRMRTLEDCFTRYNDAACERKFRFNHDGLRELVEHLGLPATVSIQANNARSGQETHINITREELTLILLRRMTYASRWCDIEDELGLSEPMLSRCFEWAVHFLTERYSEGLQDISRWAPYAAIWADAVYHASNQRVPNIIGMIDGTCRTMCRPSNGPLDIGVDVQREFYNGHHRVHCLKFQTVTAPNGLIIHVFGPINGRRHDSFLLRSSQLLESLAQLTVNAGLHFCIFGDSAYPINDFILRMNKGPGLSREQVAFNTEMSKHRVTVEWGYRDIIENFKFVDYAKNLKLFLQPIASYYKVGALLTNCKNIMRSTNSNNKTAVHFQCEPGMDLETYLRFVAS